MAALKKRDSGAETELRGQLAGEYRIVRKLGAGGFGTVYEAEHPLLKRRAAVKVLHANPALDSVTVQRFIEEARSASQIQHRNIVDIFSFGTLPNGQYFYVMDLLEGVPLDRYLSDHGRLEPQRALPLLRPIAAALDALHAASIVHRDVKPGNIYLAWQGTEVVPKLLDFGLAKLLLGKTTVNTASGVPLGTPHYMSPEQCRGEHVDARADIYAFGVVCFELLTGSKPFRGDSATAVLVAHVLEAPPRVSEVCPELSPDLDEPVARMLAKDPAQRPESTLDALRALELAAHDAGISLGDGVLWLPRPVGMTTPAELARPDEIASVAVSSNTRSGLREAESRKRRRAAVLLGGALAAALVVGLMRASRPTQTLPPTAAESTPAATVEAVPEAVLPAPPRAVTPEPDHAAQPAATAPEHITLTLQGAPPGATVFVGDENLGPADRPLALPYAERALRVRIVAPGYMPMNANVVPNASQSVTLKPEKAPRPAGKRGALSRDLENPF